MLKNKQTHVQPVSHLQPLFCIPSIPKAKPTRFAMLQRGIGFGKQCFFSILPLSVSLAGLSYLLQPRTVPNFNDNSDWITFILFCTGWLLIAILHTRIVIRMNHILMRKPEKTKVDNITRLVLYKAGWVFAIGASYIFLVGLGSLLFILPGLYLAVAFYFSLFFVILKESKDQQKNKSIKKSTGLEKIKTSFFESWTLVKGKWWQTFGIFLVSGLSIVLLEQICMIFLKHQVVLANVFCIVGRIILIPFWYGCVFAMMFDKKLKNKSH
jgi:hypothetical protein